MNRDQLILIYILTFNECIRICATAPASIFLGLLAIWIDWQDHVTFWGFRIPLLRLGPGLLCLDVVNCDSLWVQWS